MGFISKIKNILFEEEEIEVPVTPVKEEKVVLTPPTYVDDVEEEKLEKAKQAITIHEDLSERDLFKTENTFNFPAFDEDEFEETLPKPKPKVVREYPEERKKRPEPVRHDYRIYEKERDVRNEKKKFKPSPIISPVYGILDKDYRPDDIMPKVKEDALKRPSRLDVDAVRKKAFGSLEDAIKETIELPEEVELNNSYEPEIPSIREKSLDELLEDSAEETIIVDEDLELENNIREIEDELDKIEEADDDLILDNKIKESSDDDTLEQDLFDLIDSMYDDKKEVED